MGGVRREKDASAYKRDEGQTKGRDRIKWRQHIKQGMLLSSFHFIPAGWKEQVVVEDTLNVST